LYNVVGREVASVDGFNYSDAMVAHGGEWTPERLDEFLTKPSDAVPGTSMSFAGLNKVDDRVDVIAYLNEHSDEPYDLAAAAEEAGAQDEGAEAAEDEAAAEEDSAQVAAEEEEMAEEAPAEGAAAEAAADEAVAEE